MKNICKDIDKSPSGGPLFCCNKCYRSEIFEDNGLYCIVDEKFNRRGLFYAKTTKNINKTAKNKGNVRLFNLKNNDFERICCNKTLCKKNRLIYNSNTICLLSI